MVFAETLHSMFGTTILFFGIVFLSVPSVIIYILECRSLGTRCNCLADVAQALVKMSIYNLVQNRN